MGQDKEVPNSLKCAGCCTCVVILLLIILLPISFMYVSFDEYAFIRNKLTNTVDTSFVYENGRYYVLPHNEAVVFPRDYQVINMSLSVSDKEEKGFFIEVAVHYRLNKGTLANIYNEFGTNYETQIRSLIESIIKNIAPQFTLDEYLNKRANITRTINDQLKDELEDIFIILENNKVFIQLITFEQATINRFLDIAVQGQDNEKRIYEQDAELIRVDTDRLSEEVQAETTIIRRTADAQALQAVDTAKAEALRITGGARGEGIASVTNELGIVTSATRKEFIKLMAIQDNIEHIRLIDVGSDPSIIVN